jgi:hypothetical protein
MSFVFCDIEDVLTIDHLQKDQTITGEHYTPEFCQFKELIMKGAEESCVQGSNCCRTMHPFTKHEKLWLKQPVVDSNNCLMPAGLGSV